MIPVNLSHYPISIQNNLLPKVQIISNIIGDYIDAQFISEDTNGTSCNTFKVIDCLSLIELYKLYTESIRIGYPIFEANIREYLGASGTVNKKILQKALEIAKK